MALDPGAMHARIIENLPEKAGHPLSHWLNVLAKGPSDKKSRMALLKTEHGLGHHTAVAIIREFEDDVPWRDGSSLEQALREAFSPPAAELYDALKAHALGIPGVNIVPCKTYVGIKAKRQFAVIKPSRTDGLHLGLALPPKSASELSEARNLGSARITALAKMALGFGPLSDLLEQAARADLKS
ncbi:MAG: DUF4287 domain-containing protein [Pseudomonadota bacterium]